MGKRMGIFGEAEKSSPSKKKSKSKDSGPSDAVKATALASAAAVVPGNKQIVAPPNFAKAAAPFGTSSSSTAPAASSGATGECGDDAPPVVGLNTLFAQPEYSETGSFAEALQKAISERKFLLVNIQSAEEFQSYTLNRDVWSNELIKDLVRDQYIFWQRDNVSEQGQIFMQYYKVDFAHQSSTSLGLPWVGFVDPRTRRAVKCWNGRKWLDATSACEHIGNFMDKYTLSTGSEGALSEASSENGLNAFHNANPEELVSRTIRSASRRSEHRLSSEKAELARQKHERSRCRSRWRHAHNYETIVQITKNYSPRQTTTMK